MATLYFLFTAPKLWDYSSKNLEPDYPPNENQTKNDDRSDKIYIYIPYHIYYNFKPS